MKKNNTQLIEKIVKPTDLLRLEMNNIKGGLSTNIRCRTGKQDGDDFYCDAGIIR